MPSFQNKLQSSLPITLKYLCTQIIDWGSIFYGAFKKYILKFILNVAASVLVVTGTQHLHRVMWALSLWHMLSSYGPWTPECVGPVVVAQGLGCSTACEILVTQPGTEPVSSALRDGFLNTQPPGMSLMVLCKIERPKYNEMNKLVHHLNFERLRHLCNPVLLKISDITITVES